MTKILAAIIALSFFACAGKARIATAPPDPALETGFREASSLYARGAYVTLKKAFSIYEELYTRPAFRERTALPFLRTCLLLSLREREIGIVDLAFSDKAARLLAENPSLSACASPGGQTSSKYPGEAPRSLFLCLTYLWTNG